MMEWMLMPLRRYAEFSGRSRRKEYWMYVLFIIIVSVVLGFVEGILGLSDMLGNNGPLSALFSLATLIPSIAVGVRRLHDTNRSGWFVLLPLPAYALLIPGIITQSTALMVVGGIAALAAVIVLLVFLCTEGTKGPNRFGEDPKGVDHSQVFA